MNPVFPSHFRTYLLVGVLFFTTNFLLAQGWQQTYPTANGYHVAKLSEGGDFFNVTLKNGPDNAFLNGFIADGNQIGFTTTTNDCPIGYPGGNFQVSPLRFFNYSINNVGDLRVRHIEFVPGDCGNIDQLYFDQVYDLPTASQIQVRDVIQSADGLAVFVGGTYGIFPGNAPPSFYFFVKKIDANTGQEIWSYTSPALSSTPQLSLPLPVSDGGVLALFQSTPLTGGLLWRIDGNGVQQFSNLVVADLESPVNGIAETAGGGFFVRNFSLGNTQFSAQAGYLKIAADGTSVFSGSPTNILENSLGSFPFPVSLGTSVETTDGGQLLAGNIKLLNGPEDGLYLIKLASDGSTSWVQFFDGLLPDLTHSIQTTDGGFLFAGKLNNDLYLLRTDADGQISTPPVPCINVLTNPNFDNGLMGWKFTGTATENGGVGEICGGAGSLTQVMSTSPGMDYSASLSAKISGNPQSAKVVLRFLTSTYMPIPTNNDQSITAADFQTIELTATAPTSAAFVQLLVYKEANGCVQIDDAVLCEGSNGNGGGPSCEVTLGATKIICDDNGTPNITGDDFWMASIEPSGTGLGSTFSISGDIQGSNLAYGQAHLFGPFSITPGNFQDFTITDDQNGCSKDFNLNQSSPCSNGGGNYIIDLELSLAQPNTNPAQYSYYAVTATIYNNSVHAASGVKVSFTKPTGVVYTGGNEFTASQGNFKPNGNQVWTVGDLPAYGTATLTVNYFLLANQAPVAYAQVTAHDQQDTDSMFGNGTPPSVNEDDEANTSGNTSTSLPDLVLSNLVLQNAPLTAGSTLGYKFDLANSGNAPTSGGFIVNAYISTDNVLSANDIQDGTVVAVDFAAGYGETSQGATILPFNLPVGNYFLILKVDATDNISESNEDNNIVFKPFIVGSGGGNGIDLSLDFTTTSDDPVIYTSKKVVLFIKNSGTETATGVKVSFPKPSGTVYTGGNEYDASQGSFNPFGNEVWTVGSLAPGAEAALEVSYFFLTSNALTPYAQVTAADQTDSDSTPGNGTCCIPNEDDEAAITLTFLTGGNGSTALIAPKFKGRSVQLEAIYPNPSYFGETTVSIISLEEGQFDLECYDLFGRLAFSQKVELEKGRNKLLLDVSMLESGTYYLNMPGQNWRYMPIRFVVARW